MKSANIFAAWLLFLCIFFFSCSPIYDNISSPEEILQNGKWSVEYYFNEYDRTTELISIRLKFYNNNSVSYCEDTDDCIGNWQLIKNVRNEMLLLHFDHSHPNVQVLNQQWNVEELNLQRIKLSNGSAHLLLRKV